MSLILEYAKKIIELDNSLNLNPISNYNPSLKFEQKIYNGLNDLEDLDKFNRLDMVTKFNILVYNALMDTHDIIENEYSNNNINFNNFENEIENLCNDYNIERINKIQNKKEMFLYRKDEINKIRKWLIEKCKIDNENKNEPSEFIKNKIWEKEESVNFPENFSVQGYKIKFKNNIYSLEIKENGKWNIVEPIQSSQIMAIESISHAILKNKLKKYPKIEKKLSEFLIYNNYKIEDTLRVADKIITNKQLFKNKNINVLELIEKSKNILERTEDVLDEIITINNVEKFALSIMSNKYKHLVVSETKNEIEYSDFKKNMYESFKELRELGINKKELQMYIGVKLEKYKNSSELEVDLNKLSNLLNEFNVENIEKKLNNYNTKIIYKNENKLIAEILDFEASNKVGSQSWCISNYENYWNDYVGNNNRQFFAYDFSKESKKPDSMVGITLTKNNKTGEYYRKAAHYKDDCNIEKDSSMLNNYIKLINKHINKKIINKNNRP